MLCLVFVCFFFVGVLLEEVQELGGTPFSTGLSCCKDAALQWSVAVLFCFVKG